MKGVSLMSDKDQGQGFIKLFRKMTTWEWYTDTVVKVVFIHCLLKANYKEKRWKGQVIKRGQFITSYTNMAKECGITVMQARRAISTLCTTGEITHSPRAKFSIITVIGYDEYQSDNRVNNTQTNKQTTSKQQQHKNIKNRKEIKETPDLKNPWIGIADDGEEYFIDKQKYEEWNNEHGIVEE